MFGAGRGSGVPGGGALDDLAHAIEPEGGCLAAALAPSDGAAGSRVLDAEFEL